MVNMTNRHVHILPVLVADARQLQLIVLQKLQNRDDKRGQFAADWALLTQNEPLANHLMSQQGWRFVAEDDARLWTNDYSNIIPLLKWG